MCVAELFRSRFEEQGLLQGDNRGFEPHLTIMKLSRASKLRSQVCKYTCMHTHTNIISWIELCDCKKNILVYCVQMHNILAYLLFVQYISFWQYLTDLMIVMD